MQVEKEHRRSQLSVRLDPQTIDAVERVAEAQARTRSNVARTILADWAAGRPARIAPSAEGAAA